MGVTTAQNAKIKYRQQHFSCQLVAFSPITWTENMPAAGAITWQPFCLLSPRFAFTTGASVIIYGADSYTRPTTACDTVTFAKVSGDGTVTDNADKTCTVSYPGGESAGITKVEATATDAAAETATGYAYVYYAPAVGNLDAIAARCEGFSGSLATGEWKADLVLCGDYSAVLTNDGRDQPILLHVDHYWNGVADTFGGYKRHENTFVLLCRDSTIRVKHSGQYETVLHLETPAYVLNQQYVHDMRFSTSAADGIYSTADLTATDPAYYVLREGTNLHEYFNMSLWNNASTVSEITLRAGATHWEAVRDAANFNFGVMYFNRWSNLNAKPDPRVRYTEWDAIDTPPYDGAITVAHFLEYNLKRRRTDQCTNVALQAVMPDMSVLDSGTAGDVVITGLVAKDAAELSGWASQYKAWLNTEYEIEFVMPMGHELNPGDKFTLSAFTPPIGDALDQFSWVADDVNYEFDFSRGFWVRRIHAVKVTVPE